MPEKRGKLSLITILVISIILILSILIFYFLSLREILLAPPELTAPQDCSDSDINLVWNSLFLEPSSGATIISNTSESGRCNSYLAYKIVDNQVYVLGGKDFNNETKIAALKANSTDPYKSLLQNITNISSSQDSAAWLLSGFSPQAHLENRSISLDFQGAVQANSEFTSTFNFIPAAWTPSTNPGRFWFVDDETQDSYNRTLQGTVLANYSASYLLYTKTPASSPVCTPNWTSQDTACNASDYKVRYYTDTANCNTDSGKPGNQTLECDNNNDGIIGNYTSINSSFASQVYINSSLFNSSQNIANKTLKVEIKSSSGQSRVEFTWNFSLSPLNVRNIIIEKQSSSASYGTLLIRGLSASKKVWVDRLSSSNRICVRNSDISGISSMTTNCTSSSEILLACPDSESGVSCEIEDDYFTVEGLTSSGVKELPPTPIANCTPDWNCTAWSTCVNSNQTRTCTDKNACGNLSSRPPLKQACSISSPGVCTPSWSCTPWTPTVCPENKTQYQTCTDSHACNVTTGKPSETRTCTSETPQSDSNLWLIVVIIILVIIILVIVIVIFIVLNKDKVSPSNMSRVRVTMPPR